MSSSLLSRAPWIDRLLVERAHKCTESVEEAMVSDPDVGLLLGLFPDTTSNNNEDASIGATEGCQVLVECVRGKNKTARSAQIIQFVSLYSFSEYLLCIMCYIGNCNDRV
jgi:hypothetical protein